MAQKWRCGACGYVHDGHGAPEACPKCAGPREKFVALADDEVKLVERSRHTNALHCRMVDLARQMEAVCKDGIADDLDPGCVTVFGKALDECYVIMKRSMTEMSGHAAKGKWC